MVVGEVMDILHLFSLILAGGQGHNKIRSLSFLNGSVRIETFENS